MFGEGEAGGQVPADRFDVRIGEQGHPGGAEIKAPGVVLRHGENTLNIALRRFGGDGVAGKGRVFFVGAFDVHGKGGDVARCQHVGHHAGIHGVGVELDGIAQCVNVGEDGLQTVHGGGFAASDGDTVQPFGAVLQKAHHGGLVEGWQRFMVPCHGGIVAGGAMQIAPAKKDDTAGFARPVAQAKAFKATNGFPGLHVLHS